MKENVVLVTLGAIVIAVLAWFLLYRTQVRKNAEKTKKILQKAEIMISFPFRRETIVSTIMNNFHKVLNFEDSVLNLIEILVNEEQVKTTLNEEASKEVLGAFLDLTNCENRNAALMGIKRIVECSDAQNKDFIIYLIDFLLEIKETEEI